jgi:hypothetical protein
MEIVIREFRTDHLAISPVAATLFLELSETMATKIVERHDFLI